MTMKKIDGMIHSKIIAKQGDQKISPSGELKLKNVIIEEPIQPALSASVVYLNESGSVITGSGSIGLPGQYTTDRGLNVTCCPDANAPLWGMRTYPQDHVPFKVPDETSALCPQFGVGMIREFELDLDLSPDQQGRGGWLFGAFPQFCQPVAVAVVIVEDLSGSQGQPQIENVGIHMREQGGYWADGVDTANYGWDNGGSGTNKYGAKPVPCAGDGPRFYTDDHYFYSSASMANCCFPAISGSGQYAVYGANQGGNAYGFPRTGGIYASFDRTNVVYPTSSYISLTQFPINDLKITFTNPVWSGKIRICSYFHRIGGGFFDSQNFLETTPAVTGSGYAGYGPYRGIYRNCVSGTIV
tara:strand:- start:202 stop:1269 length:1068 start_codon:yes stop_codon:yes gene_type:complete